MLQKHDILSYKIHRFYPVQLKRHDLSLAWSEVSLLDKTPETANRYLAEIFDQLFYKKTWDSNLPWVSATLYYLKQDHVELHICLSHLIADEYSLSIFFQELSNAYLFFAKHTTLN